MIGGKLISCRKFKSIQVVHFHQESQQIHPEKSSEGGFGLSRCLTGSLTSFHWYDGMRFSIIIIPCILVEWKRSAENHSSFRCVFYDRRPDLRRRRSGGVNAGGGGRLAVGGGGVEEVEKA